ncbi:MAG: FtsQ-type POTRA domain-containing protein [Propionibacteriaceae bacterium]|nr:FtsQ-type POTRA domain-containing protein [Propionibacteriaceae bacterium]
MSGKTSTPIQPSAPTPSSIGIADMTVALQIRKHQAGRRRAKRIVLAVLIFAIVAAAVWALLFSDWLRVRKVEVSGNSLCPTETVLLVADVAQGTPMARVDLEQVAAAVETIPAVAHANVSRSWPNTITIAVVERTIAFQRLNADIYQWIAADGVIFNATTERQGVPVLRSASTDQRLMADVATVAQALPEPVLAALVEIQAASRDTIVIQLDSGEQIIWGNAEESDLKAQVVVALLPLDGWVYDVSAPGFPTVR